MNALFRCVLLLVYFPALVRSAAPAKHPEDSTESDGVKILALAGGAAPAPAAGQAERAQWCALATKLADPILVPLAQRQLKRVMPVEAYDPAARAASTHLEALGRLLDGLAPWLELGGDDTPEGKERARLADLARKAIDAATDPASPDKMNFTEGGQPLVDAAFLSQAILRAPTELWSKLDPRVRQNLITCLESTRTIKPPETNWLLFSSTVEALLHRVGAHRDEARLMHGLERFQHWYVGDGVYGDGAEFHWDYYNAYVIQPMLLDILAVVGDETPELRNFRTEVHQRAQRYAAIQERLIAPDGTFPVVGRSIAYRAGAFQGLAAVALHHELPATIRPGQARTALTAVLRRTLGAPDTFDGHGWLRIGLAGHQPALAEKYISTGSLYLCSFALLPLGLPASDPFWTEPAAPSTWQQVWSGADLPADSALKAAH